jgi:hypothetical protein
MMPGFDGLHWLAGAALILMVMSGGTVAHHPARWAVDWPAAGARLRQAFLATAACSGDPGFCFDMTVAEP